MGMEKGRMRMRVRKRGGRVTHGIVQKWRFRSRVLVGDGEEGTTWWIEGCMNMEMEFGGMGW